MKMKAYIPGTLSFENNKQRDKYYFLLTSIYYGRILDKRNHAASYISLHSKILIRILGGRYKEYMRFLLVEGIIETNNHYVTGEKSKGYRFATKYAKTKCKQVFITDKNIIRKIKMFKKEKDKGICSKQHRFIYRNLQNISIKSNEARKYVEKNISNINEYNSYNISIDLIAAKDFFFNVDSTAGRIHNNVTNFPGNLRKFLRYENKKLAEIDIANSQPFLFNILLYDYFKNDNNFSNIKYEIEDNYHIYPYGNQNITGYADIEEFKELTSQGTFYEFLMTEMDIEEDRSTFKVKFFSKIFFSKENSSYVSVERQRFKDLFPNVYKIVSYYKKKDYTNLAITLQKVEADIIINHVVPKLAEKKIYALTIHDSILTLPENVEIVKRVILEEFANKYGLVPTLKVK